MNQYNKRNRHDPKANDTYNLRMTGNKMTESVEDKTRYCNERVGNTRIHCKNAGKKELKQNKIMGKKTKRILIT